MIDVTFNYPITNRVGVYAMLSAASYHGGFMDGVIENFHSAFGFEQYGRPGLTRNQFNLLYDLKGIQYTQLDRPDERGLLDPVLGLRYALMPKPDSFNVVLDCAIKVPLGGDVFFSTGRVDIGAQLTAQWHLSRHAFYASGALVYYGGSPAPFNDLSQLCRPASSVMSSAGSRTPISSVSFMSAATQCATAKVIWTSCAETSTNCP